MSRNNRVLHQVLPRSSLGLSSDATTSTSSAIEASAPAAPPVPEQDPAPGTFGRPSSNQNTASNDLHSSVQSSRVHHEMAAHTTGWMEYAPSEPEHLLRGSAQLLDQALGQASAVRGRSTSGRRGAVSQLYRISNGACKSMTDSGALSDYLSGRGRPRKSDIYRTTYQGRGRPRKTDVPSLRETSEHIHRTVADYLRSLESRQDDLQLRVDQNMRGQTKTSTYFRRTTTEAIRTKQNMAHDTADVAPQAPDQPSRETIQVETVPVKPGFHRTPELSPEAIVKLSERENDHAQDDHSPASNHPARLRENRVEPSIMDTNAQQNPGRDDRLVENLTHRGYEPTNSGTTSLINPTRRDSALSMVSDRPRVIPKYRIIDVNSGTDSED